MEDLIAYVRLFLLERGAPEEAAIVSATCFGIVLLVILAWAAKVVARNVLRRVVLPILARTRFTWDDAFVKAGVFSRLAHLAPALLINALGPGALGGSPAVLAGVQAGVNLYLVLICVAVLFAILDATYALSEQHGRAKGIPIKGFIQAIKLIATLFGVILAISILLGKTPLYLVSGLGALTAVLLLVFRDAILGFVAGIMISTNEMVRIGDWIEMDKAGADGFVIDVSLTTVKVQNWDKTITTIPSYDLISASFKNWRGMFDTGGRRIKRAIFIDMESIRFADESMLERWMEIGHLRDYLQQKLGEIAKVNERLGTAASILGNGRRLTNIGTFRAYCTAYLRAHPGIHQEMIFLIRQLAPTPHGLPLELYIFTRDTGWVAHEGVQADIFDHLLSVIGVFGLRVYQRPSGYNLRRVLTEVSASSGLSPETDGSATSSRC